MVTPVMFVDDEISILKAMKRLFLDAPFEVLVAESPSKALETLKEHTVAVVVSDQHMPEMLGTDFLEKVRSVQPHAVRMILTGYADLESAMDAINRGQVYRFICKPWDETDLKTAIKNAVDLYTLESENRRLLELTLQQNTELKHLNQDLEKRVEDRTREINGLIHDLRGSFSQMVRGLMGVMEIFQPSLGGHSKRVAAISLEIGRLYKRDERETQMLEISALLHDIGLMGLPRAMFEKDESQLLSRELGLIKQHPGLGYTILNGVNGLREAALAVFGHHENFDGTGYPLGLKNEEISLGARIIRVANDLDNLTHRHGINMKRAIASLQAKSGTEYDPEVVGKLIDVLDHLKARREGVKIVHLEDLKAGMVAARPVKTTRGVLLLSQHTELQPMHIQKLLGMLEQGLMADRISVVAPQEEEIQNQYLHPSGLRI